MQNVLIMRTLRPLLSVTMLRLGFNFERGAAAIPGRVLVNLSHLMQMTFLICSKRLSPVCFRAKNSSRGNLHWPISTSCVLTKPARGWWAHLPGNCTCLLLLGHTRFRSGVRVCMCVCVCVNADDSNKVWLQTPVFSHQGITLKDEFKIRRNYLVHAISFKWRCTRANNSDNPSAGKPHGWVLRQEQLPWMALALCSTHISQLGLLLLKRFLPP